MKSFDIKPTNFSPKPSTAPSAATAEITAPQSNNASETIVSTSGTQSPGSTRRNSLLIIILVAALVLILSVTAALVFFYGQASTLRSQLNDKEADLKSAQVKISVLNQSTDNSASVTQTPKADDKVQIAQSAGAWFSGQVNFAGQIITPQLVHSDSTYALVTAKTDYDNYSCALKKVNNAWLVVACATDLPAEDLSANWGFPSAILNTK